MSNLQTNNSAKKRGIYAQLWHILLQAMVFVVVGVGGFVGLFLNLNSELRYVPWTVPLS